MKARRWLLSLATALPLVACGAAQTVTVKKVRVSPVVARIGDAPVSLAEYDHWYRVAEASHGSVPSRSEVMDFLISSAWVNGEAAQRGVSVTASEVDQEYERIKAKQFPNQAEFQQFLATSGQTEDDLRFRVRLNMLSRRLRVAAGGNTAGVEEIIRAFKTTWLAKTACAPAFMVPDCGASLP